MVIEVLKAAWPFLREFFLGGKKNPEGTQQPKRQDRVTRLFMFVLFLASLGLNAYLLPRTYDLSTGLYRERVKRRAAEDELAKLKGEVPKPPAKAPKDSWEAIEHTPASTGQKELLDAEAKARYDAVMARMEAIQRGK
jgi:hypothetical protein